MVFAGGMGQSGTVGQRFKNRLPVSTIRHRSRCHLVSAGIVPGTDVGKSAGRSKAWVFLSLGHCRIRHSKRTLFLAAVKHPGRRGSFYFRSYRLYCSLWGYAI